ncbi:DUF5129 domain-containing protein [Brachybacterium sp. AOP29-B2-41]|uniref:DUF5129 domain-containing protein n=1 Tax=Brachybacterium sp. AOP29-B2-41 TaxID=3457704 RepID=UPI00403462F9
MDFSPVPAVPHASTPAAGAAGVRSLPRVLALCALLLLAFSVLVPAPAHAVPPSTVSVLDTTGSVEKSALEDDLAEVDFRTEVDLVVLVLDVTEHGYSASEDTALNDTVRDHAQTSAPELLSPDGQHFADGTVILAVDPVGRFLGTYAGEDVKLSEDEFNAVQESMTEDTRDGQWNAALLAGAEEYADLLQRPWWQKPSAIIAGAVALGAAVLTVVSLVGLRRAARRRVDQSLPRYRDVLAKRALTDAAARTMPTASPYAQAMLEEHEEYGQGLTEAERLHAELPAPEHRRWSWGFASAHRRLAKDFENTVSRLDDTDDAIVSAADLLHRIGDWRTAWQRELDPLQDSLSGLEEVLAKREEMSEAERQAAAELTELGGDVAREMDSLTAQLKADQIDPDSALERLDTLTRELSAAVMRLQTVHIAEIAEDDGEAEVLREAADDVDFSEDDEYSSLRARRHRREHGSAGGSASDQFWSLSPVLWYSSWHHESTSALETHRNPPSSSGGSTSGYSSGGFSGAGSSSRF